MTKYIINDQSTTEDRLDFKPYVDTLVDIIKTGDTPLTIGVFGTWGSGKTSLMKMVKKKLPKKYTVVWFDAWKYDKEETLWRALLLSVLVEIRKIVKSKNDSSDSLDYLETMLYRAVDIEKLGGVKVDLLKIGGMFAKGTVELGLSFIPGGAILSKFIEELQKSGAKALTDDLTQAIQRERTRIHIEQVRFLEQFQDKFKDLIQQFVVPNRIVIFVDDLDRCLPEKAIEVLEAIKLFLDSENCIFLLGLDQEVIARGIEVKYKGLNKNDGDNKSHFAFEGVRYLEKIIQLPFQIPPVEQTDMNSFVNGLSNEWPHEDCPNVFAIALDNNPRQIKRTVNVFFMLWKLSDKRKEKLQGLIKPVRLAKLVAIQAIYPELYNLLKQTPFYLSILEEYYRKKDVTGSPGEDTPTSNEGENQPATSLKLPPELEQLASNLIVRRILTLHSVEGDFSFIGLSPDELRLYFTLTRRAEAPQIGSVPSSSESRVEWDIKHPFPMPPDFTGRNEEHKVLSDWLEKDINRPMLILLSLGGFGKSALAWHWLNSNVDIVEWQKVVWWSFYEVDANFENFVKESLEYLNIEVPQGQRPQVDELLKAMQSQKILFILDGFERTLRAYSSMNASYQNDENLKRDDNGRDCVSMVADQFLKSICTLPNIRSKVLITTRLTPSVLESQGQLLQGCQEIILEALNTEDAVSFLRRGGILGTNAELAAACAAYGSHPLSLRILAGLILNDRESPGDIALAGKLNVTNDIRANRHHVLEQAYNSLSSNQQKLLSLIACFRAPVTYDALKVIHEKQDSVDNLDNSLKVFEKRGLLYWDRESNRYKLHPVVRRYAYDRLTVADRTNAHTRLVNYFEMVPKPEKVTVLEDLAPVIELYHHLVMAGQFDAAANLYYDRLDKAIYYQFGANQIAIELLEGLFPNGENSNPQLSKESDQNWALNSLANAYILNGQARRAIPLLESQRLLQKEIGDKKNLAIGLKNVAQMAQLNIGALEEGERNIRRSIEISHEIQDEFGESVGYQELGRVLSYRGIWQEADQALTRSLEIAEKFSNLQMQGVTWMYRCQRALLMARDVAFTDTDNIVSATECAKRAFEIMGNGQISPNVRDLVRVKWFLGKVYLLQNQIDLSEKFLYDALSQSRAINIVDYESDILLSTAQLRYQEKRYHEVKFLIEEAQIITERGGYVLQGADVNLFLAQYALDQENDKKKAREYAESALRLATCDGPPYHYKVVYEEAERMLDALK